MKFNEICYEVLKLVPRGKVVTYKTLANAAGGKAYRAVGSLMRRNNESHVNCHRVIRSDGNVGEYNGGKNEKIRRLREEGVEVIDEMIDLEKFEMKL